MPDIHRFLFASLIGIFMYVSSAGQTIPAETVKDESVPPKTIELSSVPVHSLEVISQVKQAFKDLIPPHAVKKLKLHNDLVMAMTDTSLLSQADPESPSVNLRYLENRRLMLEEERKKIKNEENSLKELINPLDTLSTWMSNEIAAWNNTISLHKGENISATLLGKMKSTVVFLDSSQSYLNIRTQTLNRLLERTNTMSISIDLSLERTKVLLKRKERNSLYIDAPPFFQLEFAKNYFKEISQSFSNVRNVKLRELGDYFSYHLDSLFFLIVIIILLFLFFNRLRTRIQVNMEGYGKFYKQMFLLMLSQPLAGAIIVSLTLSVVLFPGRPVSFRELQTYVFAIPLIFLLNRILQRLYRLYFYVFTVTLLLCMIQILLSPDTTIYRVMLFLIAIVEIGLLSMLLHKIRKERRATFNQKRMLYVFFALNVLLAVTGLFANIFGRVTLTEMAMNAIFSNILTSVTLFITSILINGMIAGGIDSQTGRKINTFVTYGELIKIRAIRIINIVSVFFWINIVLSAFHVDDFVLGVLFSALTYTFKVGTISFSISLLIIFFSVIFLAYYLAKFLQVMLEQDILIRMPLAKGLPHTIAVGLKYLIVIGGFFLAVNATGMPLDKVTIILGAFSVGIGFGLQNIFNNMVSGLILLFERPIQLGDTVQVGQLTGQVKSIDLRSSNIHTFDGAEVIVPNGQLVSNEVINWTLSDKKRRLEVTVGVGYDSDPVLVHKLLLEIIQTNTGVIQDPEPFVLFSNLGQSSLDFTLVFWIADYNMGRKVKSDVLFDIFRVLGGNGIKIPYPQQDVHIIPGKVREM